MKDLRDDLSRFELLAEIGTKHSGLSSLDLKHFCGVDIGIQNFKRGMPLETEAGRNFDNYRAAILFYCGKLDMYPQESH